MSHINRVSSLDIYIPVIGISCCFLVATTAVSDIPTLCPSVAVTVTVYAVPLIRLGIVKFREKMVEVLVEGVVLL